MKRSIFILAATLLASCANSPVAVKQKHFLGQFQVDNDHEHVSAVIAEMSQYCGTPIFKVKREVFPALHKSTVSTTDSGGHYYYLHVDVTQLKEQQSQVSIYHAMNTKVTQDMAQAVTQWVKQDSRECVGGF